MITNTVSKVTYTGDGTTKQFQVTFPFVDSTELQLFLRTISTGDIDDITGNWSYNEGYVTYPVSGSAITSAKQIVIQRNTPLTQEKDHNVRLFTSEDIENIADKLTRISQELKRDLDQVSSPESVDIDISKAISRHNQDNDAHYDLMQSKASKSYVDEVANAKLSVTGGRMTGELVMDNANIEIEDVQGDSFVLDTIRDSVNNVIFCIVDKLSGAGLVLLGDNGFKPFYTDGVNPAIKLLDSEDKGIANGIASLDASSKIPLSQLPGAVITETYSNGTSWYRVWSDGWCEQGGLTSGITGNTNSVTLLKTFASTSFTVQLTPEGPNAITYTPAYSVTSTNTINIGLFNDTAHVYWRAEGYLESGD